MLIPYQQASPPQVVSPFQPVHFPAHGSRPSFGSSSPLPAFPKTGVIQVNQGGPLVAQRLPQVVILRRSPSAPGLASGPSFHLPAGALGGQQVRGQSVPAGARLSGQLPVRGESTPGTPSVPLQARGNSTPHYINGQPTIGGTSTSVQPHYAQTPKFFVQQQGVPQFAGQQQQPLQSGPQYPLQQIPRAVSVPDAAPVAGSQPAHAASSSTAAPEPSIFGLGEALVQSVVALVTGEDQTPTAPQAPPAASHPFSQQLFEKEAQVDHVLLRGQYRIVRQQFRPSLPLGVIGKGAFGMVYRGVKDGNNVDVAVKMVEARCPLHKELIAKEIEVLQMVNHPSIVNLQEVIVEHALDWMFIVMEFVEGGDLLDRLTQDPSAFDEALVRVLMFHVTCGLAYAHSQGIMHRDIKPENILICKDGFPKVADFGLARTMGMGNQASQPWKTMAGSPAYSAPEVTHTESSYDFSADTFSLGLLFADLLHPKVLCSWIFDRMNAGDKNRFMKKWPPGVAGKDISSMLQQIQQKMIQQVPGHRPSLHQICQDLLALAKSDPMPHPFWGRQTVMPEGPPKQRAVSPEQAAEIAGRSGYALWSPVQVQAGGWWSGVVEHINTTVCPGAVHVRFKNGQGVESCVLVAPWHFSVCLRPNPQGVAPPAGGEPRTRTLSPDGKGNGTGKGGGKGKGPMSPQDAIRKCTRCRCVVM